MNTLSIIARLATKTNRRVFATMLGIAFCVTYLTGTMSMVNGLHNTTETIAASFDQGPILLFSNEDLSMSRVSIDSLPENESAYVAFCMINVTFLDYAGHSVKDIDIISLYDPEDKFGLNMTNESASTQVLMGTQLMDELTTNYINIATNNNYTLKFENKSIGIRLDTLYPPGSIFPDDWLFVPRTVIDSLKPEMTGNYSFLMVIDEDGSLDRQQLLFNGIYTRPTSGVVNFFESGIYQVEDDLWTIVLITGVVITLLVYSIISIETEYNAPTIKILRGVGATRKYVVQIFLMKACFITMIGGIVGAAMGFCAASAIASVSSVLGIMTFITPAASLSSILLPLVMAIVSGLIGGFWPAIRASRLLTSQRREEQ